MGILSEMVKNIVDILVKYAKATSTGKIILHALIAMMLSTWIGFIYLAVTYSDTIISMYTRYAAQNTVKIEDALKVSQQVNTLVADQRTRLGVDRLYVSKFHNGKVDLSGIHFIYISRVSESTAAGVSNEISTAQNLPLSIFPDMLTAISQNKCYYVKEVNDGVENSTFLSSMGIKSTMICPIYSTEGKLIGLIGADGTVDSINTTEAPELEAKLKTIASVLGGLLIL